MRRLILPVLVLLTALMPACGNPTQPCGTFSFTGSPTTNRGVDVVVNFNFDPATCGATCMCNRVAYIQIVRIIDQNTGNFLAPNSDQQNRIVTGQPNATQNGWAVDRLSGRNFGYYGRNNDGTFASTLTPGSNTTTAVLRDTPSGWPDNSWFDAVSVPVCIDTAAACGNSLDGYYYWLFVVGTGGTTQAPFHEVGVDWMQDALDRAVIEWNNDAAGLGKTSFPAMTRL
jgi:hypothetical protein